MRLAIIMLIYMTISASIFGIAYKMGQTSKITIQPELDTETKDLEIIYSGVTGSGSMLPMVNPDTILEKIKFEGQPKCGHVYVYQKNEDTTIVHRYVYEGKTGQYYFKGDNNQYMDAPINKSQILHEVIGVKI